jgi:hypothetical protein
MVITGFVLAILSLLLGSFPVIGWLLLIPATIFTALSYKESEKRGLSIASLVLVIVTWIYKIVIVVTIFVSVANFSTTMEGIEVTIDGEEQALEQKYDMNEPFLYEKENIEYTVTHVETLDKINEATPQDDHLFVAVQFDLKNVGAEPLSWLSASSGNLMSDNGSTYDEQLHASSQYRYQMSTESSLFNDVPSYSSIKRSTVFEIPKNALEGELYFAIENLKVKIN